MTAINLVCYVNLVVFAINLVWYPPLPYGGLLVEKTPCFCCGTFWNSPLRLSSPTRTLSADKTMLKCVESFLLIAILMYFYFIKIALGT